MLVLDIHGAVARAARRWQHLAGAAHPAAATGRPGTAPLVKAAAATATGKPGAA